jgi:hypothetical protein
MTAISRHVSFPWQSFRRLLLVLTFLIFMIVEEANAKKGGRRRKREFQIVAWWKGFGRDMERVVW